MKKTYFFYQTIFLILLLSGFAYSQCYTVLSVKGEIVLEKTGKPIGEMDEVCATDKLIFGTADSKAAVLSSEQGRFVIKLSGKKKTDALTAFVSSVLFSGKGGLSTKAFDLEELNTFDYWGKEFGEKYFVIGKSKIIIDKNILLSNENNYFFIKYLYDGKEIESKLKFDKDTLFIDSDVYKIEGNIIEQEKIDTVYLYYFDKEKSKRIELASFNLKFANEEKLKSELSNYISILRKAGKDSNFNVQEVIFYLNDIYGNVNENDVTFWLKVNYDLK
jgi:hypothetical protein